MWKSTNQTNNTGYHQSVEKKVIKVTFSLFDLYFWKY